MSIENGHINLKLGKILTKELKKRYEVAKKDSPSMTFSFFMKYVLWRGVKK
jgi:hypothetical protein